MKKMSVTFIIFVNVFLLTGQTIKDRDSLLRLLPKAVEDTNKVLLLYSIGDTWENSSPDSAKKYIFMGGKLSNKLNYTTGIQKYYRNLSYIFVIQSEYDSLIYYTRLGLELAKSNNDTFNIGISLFNIGIAYRFKSDYDSAIVYNLEGAKILEGKGYTNIEASLYDGLQVLYMSMAQYDKAISYGEKAISCGRKLKNKNPLAVALNNLALSYMEVEQIDKAKEVLKEAISISGPIENKSVEGVALNNLAEIAIREAQFDQLKYYADKSIQIFIDINAAEGLSISNRCLAIYYLSQKDFKKANEYCQVALKIAEENELLQEKSHCFLTFSQIAFAQHDFAGGFKFMIQSQKIDGEIFNESLSEKEAVMRVKFETAKKELLIQNLETDNEIKTLSLQKKKIINFVLLGGIFWISLVSFLVYRNLKHRQKLQQNRIQELETEKQLMAAEAVLKGEEQERTRIAKDLHDGLGGMLSGLKHSFTTMKGNLIMTPENHQAFERGMDMLDSSIKEMRRVAHNMMPEALVRFGLDTALKDFCNDINQSGAIKIDYHSVNMQDAELEQTTSITIYRIIQELINNVIKHARATSAIVQVIKTDEKLAITVEDNGIGFDTSILTTNNGIGWINIKNRVEFLKGMLDISSRKDEGTSVQIEINS